ncbi:MAG: deoxyribodipyrimidine photolyase [Armatimonadetes bacterium]|nr:deoxyribodipyrimidine photolyase [Armatimonadota bacterium]
MKEVPEIRIRAQNTKPVQRKGNFVLYWMMAARRTRSNFALQRSVAHARELQRPLLVLETLELGGRWDSRRMHEFVLDGMADNATRFSKSAATYYPFVEHKRGEVRELVAALSAQSCMVVTDDFPTHNVPRELTEVTARVGVCIEAVDGNGLLPMRVTERVFPTAYAFRRFLQTELPAHLTQRPAANPLARVQLEKRTRLPKGVAGRWPAAKLPLRSEELRKLPIDHSVGFVKTRGGARAAERVLKHFATEKLARYAEDRNEPEKDATSGLSPYLHYGHISSHDIFSTVAKQQGWGEADLSQKATGSRRGWWGMEESAEAFLDQLVTWRELGFNMAWQRDDHDGYDSLPDWARETLEHHEKDYRPQIYSFDEFENAQTHDKLWNAAQMQLVREGRLHNYLRMLWGKKILEWSPSPKEAAETMVELNNKYSLDGQDPNSYSGIFWCLGRYDRPWGPERPIFGKIRYMSSENTARKVKVREFVETYAP